MNTVWHLETGEVTKLNKTEPALVVSRYLCTEDLNTIGWVTNDLENLSSTVLWIEGSTHVLTLKHWEKRWETS
jgi:hypothetical protein